MPVGKADGPSAIALALLPRYIGINNVRASMLNPRVVNIYGYVAIGAMTIMLLLIVTKVVPQRMFMPLFYVAAGLFAVRIVLRIIQARQQKALREHGQADIKGDGEE